MLEYLEIFEICSKSAHPRGGAACGFVFRVPLGELSVTLTNGVRSIKNRIHCIFEYIATSYSDRHVLSSLNSVIVLLISLAAFLTSVNKLSSENEILIVHLASSAV